MLKLDKYMALSLAVLISLTVALAVAPMLTEPMAVVRHGSEDVAKVELIPSVRVLYRDGKLETYSVSFSTYIFHTISMQGTISWVNVSLAVRLVLSDRFLHDVAYERSAVVLFVNGTCLVRLEAPSGGGVPLVGEHFANSCVVFPEETYVYRECPPNCPCTPYVSIPTGDYVEFQILSLPLNEEKLIHYAMDVHGCTAKDLVGRKVLLSFSFDVTVLYAFIEDVPSDPFGVLTGVRRADLQGARYVSDPFSLEISFDEDANHAVDDPASPGDVHGKIDYSPEVDPKLTKVSFRPNYLLLFLALAIIASASLIAYFVGRRA